MDLHFGTVRRESELQQILELQKSNLAQNLSVEEKGKEGFVTVVHTLELLTRMNAKFPHVIARDGKKVVGYTLCMHPKFAGEIEVLKPMFSEIERSDARTREFMVMGQVCIDKEYRKKGIFRNLYQTMLQAIKPRFDCIITEVDAANVRSLQAHYAVGFRELKRYHSDGHDWHVILLE